MLLADVADAHEGPRSNDYSLCGDHHNGIVAWGCDTGPGLAHLPIREGGEALIGIEVEVHQLQFLGGQVGH